MANIKRKITSKSLHKEILLLSIFFASLLFSCSLWRDETADVYVPTDATIIVDSRPFFPFGFYHVSFYLTANQRIKAIRDIAAAGFNTIHASCSKLDDYGAFLDEAKRLGIYVITEFKGTNPIAVVRQFKDKPAVLGWSIADDGGDHQSSAQILNLHRQVKAADPKHLTYISVSGWSKNWAGYAHVADLIGGQSYPIGYPFGNQPKGLPNDLSEVNYVFNLARAEADKRNRPVIANLQTFNWSGQRWPTADEVYNMTYQALLAGVKGILFYTYDDGESRIRDNPDVWNRVKSMVPEINKLSPVLLEGTLTKLDTQVDDLFAGQWTHGSSVYVVVLSTSPTKTRQVSITIPARAKGSAQPLFRERPSGMVFENGKLSGLIKPGDVHVYQLSN